jgi:choline dehydrogenase-like flavoprotein
MIEDSSQLADGAVVTADVCIIGGGAAGICIAQEMDGSTQSVLLIESGDLVEDEATQALYEGTMSGLDTWELHKMRMRVFGGSTEHWGGWCRPLRPEDFEQRAWMDQSGWPISFADLEPYYERAQAVLELGPFQYDAGVVAAHEGLPLLFPQGGAVQTDLFQFSSPTRLGTVYRSQLARSSNVRVLLRANLVEIRLGDSGQVSHLICQTLDGNELIVEASRFVLATGGIENARLLLASNTQESAGVANGTDQVGRWFMEHPHYGSSVAVVSPMRLDLDFYTNHDASVPRPDGSGVDPAHIGGVFALSAAIRDAEGLPDWTMTIKEADLSQSELAPLGPTPVGALSRCPDEPTFYRLFARVEQTPLADSRVTLSSERDALGMPRVDLNWKISEADDRAMRRSFEIFGAELARHCLGRAWVPTQGERFKWRAGPGGHHMGTTRMGTDPATSVVDADSRCHEVANLYMAGSSVFTTGGSANPTLTVVALALRLADHLLEVG